MGKQNLNAIGKKCVRIILKSNECPIDSHPPSFQNIKGFINRGLKNPPALPLNSSLEEELMPETIPYHSDN